MNPTQIATAFIGILRDAPIVFERFLRDHSSLLVLAIAAASVLLVGGCTAARTAVHNFADLDDHRIFANRTVERAGASSPLRPLSRVPRFVAEMRVPDENGTLHALDDYLDETRTAAFVVLRDDELAVDARETTGPARALVGDVAPTTLTRIVVDQA